MKRIPALWGPAAFAICLAAGCSHLDLAPQSDPSRVLTGTVVIEGQDGPLPDDAVVLVRVVDTVPPAMIAPQLEQSQTLKRPTPPPDAPPAVLGEQTIHHPGTSPIPFQVEYQAAEDQLQHGVDVDVRVSFNGHVQYMNLDHYEVGLNDYTEPQTIRVDAATR
jgi:uncharacterized lipoprotein YbaY